MRKALIAVSLGLLAFLMLADPAWAIPAFARKYSYSCTTCHAPAPRLKPFGEDFAGRGFRLEDPSQEPARATRDTGDPLLQLMREVPLAIRLEGFAAYKEDADAEYDFEYPWAFKVLSGGPISDKISYYFYYIIEKGGESGLEDAYLQLNKPFGLPFDLLFGQFQVCDPLFKRELRLERNDYLIYKAKPGYSLINLTYDRGLMAASTLPGDIDMVLGIYNGSGLKEMDPLDGSYDVDKDKSYSARFARQFGPVRLGLFGYFGKENAKYYENTVDYWGPDLMIDLSDNLQINIQYLERTDDPDLTDSDAESKVDGGFVEFIWLPNGPEGRWALSALYNRVDYDYYSYVGDLAMEQKAENASITLNYLLARNIRVLTEVQMDFDVDPGGLEECKDVMKASIGVSAAF
jgi:hypothetical protein